MCKTQEQHHTDHTHQQSHNLSLCTVGALARHRVFKCSTTTPMHVSLLIASIAAIISTIAASSIASGTVVQFIVYAEEQSYITRVFPGAYVDFTWNNVFVVSIWTNDAARLIQDIQKTLQEHESEIQTLVPPYTMAAATQKWLQYNMVWVFLLLLVFTAGCACGGFVLSKCTTIKQPRQPHPRSCRTRF